MSEKISISKIQIKIGNKALDLTLEEARELKDILNTTFPEKEVIPGIYPLPCPSPIIIERPIQPYYKYWEYKYVWKGKNTGTAILSLTNGYL